MQLWLTSALHCQPSLPYSCLPYAVFTDRIIRAYWLVLQLKVGQVNTFLSLLDWRLNCEIVLGRAHILYVSLTVIIFVIKGYVIV